MPVEYLRGRCMKTGVTAQSDGTMTITSRDRGENALRPNRLQEKQRIAAVASIEEPRHLVLSGQNRF